jgi:hypothetical protein
MILKTTSISLKKRNKHLNLNLNYTTSDSEGQGSVIKASFVAYFAPSLKAKPEPIKTGAKGGATVETIQHPNELMAPRPDERAAPA